MRMLRSKLVEIKERANLEKIEDIKGELKEIAWGSQIRSYVFMPYTLVKDHRTGYEIGNISAVMDGELDGFINAYLKAAANGTLEEAWCVGTAAVISPIGGLSYEGKEYEINHSQIGEVSQKLYDELTGIQWGKKPDPFGWTDKIC